MFVPLCVYCSCTVEPRYHVYIYDRAITVHLSVHEELAPYRIMRGVEVHVPCGFELEIQSWQGSILGRSAATQRP